MRLTDFAKPYWPLITLAAIFSLLMGIFAALLVQFIGPGLSLLTRSYSDTITLKEFLSPGLFSLVRQFIPQTEIAVSQFIFFIEIGLLVVAFGKAFSWFLQNYLWEKTGELISKDIRKTLFSSYLKIDPSLRHEDRLQKVEQNLSSIQSADLKIFKEYWVHFYGGVPREAVQSAFMIISLLLLTPKLFLFFLLLILPTAFIIKAVGKKVRKKSGAALTGHSQLTEWLLQRFLGIETIKQSRTEKIEIDKMAQMTTWLYSKQMRVAKAKSRMSPLLEFVAICALVILVYITLSEIHKGQLTGAVALSFFASLAFLAQSLALIGRYYNKNREARAALARIKETFTTLYDFKQKTERIFFHPLPENNILSLENVCVRYKGSSQLALKNFNYSFEKGKIYCITGPSGAGKSTLFKVILGLLEPTKGKVFYNQSFANTKNFIGYLPQNMEAYSGSVLENIIYPDSFPDKERLDQAIRRIEMEPFINSLAQGLETDLTGLLVPLSGGQLQKILLCRLIYHKFPIILVDEGTSALDIQIEQLVHRSFLHLKEQGSTIIMISHRKASELIADCVIDLTRAEEK